MKKGEWRSIQMTVLFAVVVGFFLISFGIGIGLIVSTVNINNRLKPCEDIEDCTPPDNCTIVSCVTNECQFSPIPGCCTGLTSDTCNPNVPASQQTYETGLIFPNTAADYNASRLSYYEEASLIITLSGSFSSSWNWTANLVRVGSMVTFGGPQAIPNGETGNSCTVASHEISSPTGAIAPRFLPAAVVQSNQPMYFDVPVFASGAAQSTPGVLVVNPNGQIVFQFTFLTVSWPTPGTCGATSFSVSWITLG